MTMMMEITIITMEKEVFQASKGSLSHRWIQIWKPQRKKNCITKSLWISRATLVSLVSYFRRVRSIFQIMLRRRLNSRTKSTTSQLQQKWEISWLGQFMERKKMCLVESSNSLTRRAVGQSHKPTKPNSRPCRVSLACASTTQTRCRWPSAWLLTSTMWCRGFRRSWTVIRFRRPDRKRLSLRFKFSGSTLSPSGTPTTSC